MKKLSLLALMVFIFSGVYAQSTAGFTPEEILVLKKMSEGASSGQRRNLSFYMDASSGQIAPGNQTANGKKDVIPSSRDQAFEGSEMEWGIRYSQNFKNVPWLSMGGTVVFVMNFTPYYDANGNYVGSSNGVGGLSNLKGNFWISMPYFMLLIDARGLMGVYLNYGHSFGNAGTLTVGTELEFFYTGNAWYGNPGGDGYYDGSGNPATSGLGYVIDLFSTYLSYSVPLGKGFSFASSLQFRLGPNYWNGYAGVEHDPSGSLELRWNNTVAVGYDGWGFYAQLRMSTYGLAGSSQAAINIKDPAVVLQIISGISYNFDFSK